MLFLLGYNNRSIGDLSKNKEERNRRANNEREND